MADYLLHALVTLFVTVDPVGIAPIFMVLTAGFGPAQMAMQVTGASHVTAITGQLAQKATSNGTGSATMNVGGLSLPMKVTTEVTTTQIP